MSSSIKTFAELNRFAEEFVIHHPGGGIIGLTGDLGSGKTTFVRGCVEYICKQGGQTVPRIISPTFVVHQSYRHLKPSVDHFDLYRLKEADEISLSDVGYFDAYEWAKEHSGFLFVEWPERVIHVEILALTARLEFILNEDSRTIRSV